MSIDCHDITCKFHNQNESFCNELQCQKLLFHSVKANHEYKLTSLIDHQPEIWFKCIDNDYVNKKITGYIIIYGKVSDIKLEFNYNEEKWRILII